MATPLLSVCWKEHSCEVATVCRNLLAEDFLVDCTIAADGQKLKAHRLILSACSPYFRMLFSEEAEKHPIVILKDTLFDTLKAIVHFVYHGETQIPEDQLQAFFALAESLQIKGLNNSPLKDKNQNLCHNVIEDVPQCLPEDNRNTFEVQGASASHEDSAENSSQPLRSHLYPSDGHTDSVQSNTSISFEGHITSCEEVRSANIATQPHEQQIFPDCDEQALHSEPTVKHELLNSEYLEANSRVFNDIESDELVSKNFASERDKGTTPVFNEQDLNKTSSCIKTSHVKEEPTLVMPTQQQHVSQLPHPASRPHLVKEEEPMHPVLLEPKVEQMDVAEIEKSMHVLDTPTSDRNKNVTNEKTDHGFGEQYLNQSSTVIETNDLAVQSMPDGAQCVVHWQSAPLQLPADARNEGSDRPYVGATTVRTSNLRAINHARTGDGPYKCDVCGARFKGEKALSQHSREHTWELSNLCDVCWLGLPYSTSHNSDTHSDTDEQASCCDDCGDCIASSSSHTCFKRRRTDKRKYRCAECGDIIANSGRLSRHKRPHAGNQ